MLIRNEIKFFAQAALGILVTLLIVFGSGLTAVALSISARPSLPIAEILSICWIAVGLVAFPILVLSVGKSGFLLTKKDKDINVSWVSAGLCACGVLCGVAEKFLSIT